MICSIQCGLQSSQRSNKMFSFIISECFLERSIANYGGEGEEIQTKLIIIIAKS